MRSPERYMKEIGHSPYRPDQPNGWPDTKAEWLSPELLIRRLTFARRFSELNHKPKELDFEALVQKNFDNAEEVFEMSMRNWHKAGGKCPNASAIPFSVDVIIMIIKRRQFITGLSSLSLLGSPFQCACRRVSAKRNLIVIMLRGGMDGLTAVPVKDSRLSNARPDISVDETLPLTSDFQLHPRLRHFHELWQKGQAAVVHATNIPYTNRSHFEGQDVMQSGGHVPYGDNTGWLGRGLSEANLDGVASIFANATIAARQYCAR